MRAHYVLWRKIQSGPISLLNRVNLLFVPAIYVKENIIVNRCVLDKSCASKQRRGEGRSKAIIFLTVSLSATTDRAIENLVKKIKKKRDW